MGLPCPDEFVATASAVAERAAPLQLSKTRVVFATLASLSGINKDIEDIEFAKDAGIDVEIGKKYRVKLREGRVCSIEKLTEVEANTIVENHRQVNL